jgi:CTP:molybdopterin cytidylyltransferase MocA
MLGVGALENVSGCFIQNVDNPFVDVALIGNMLEVSEKGDYVVPVYKGRGGHPVLVDKTIIRAIEHLDDHQHNLRDLLTEYNRITVSVGNERVLCNVNDVGEYKRWFA